MCYLKSANKQKIGRKLECVKYLPRTDQSDPTKLSELKMKTFLDLPNEIIVYLFKFLSKTDCMALSLSGVCDRILQIYGEKG